MKLLTCLILAAGLMLPVYASANPPRPEEAVDRLGLAPELRGQVLAVFAAAREKHEALRSTIDGQRAANDAEFCSIRGETQKALAKLLSREQLVALNESMRPPRPPRDGQRGGGPRDDRGGAQQGRGGMDGPADRGPSDRGPPGGMMGHDGGERRPPPPPRCDEDAAAPSAGE